MSKSAHSKKISVDLRGFHIFDDNDSSSSEEDEQRKESKGKRLKKQFNHAKKMSVDLAGYHLFDDGESSSEDDEDAPAKPPKKMHNKKISVDLRGFDLFDDSDSDSESSDDDEHGKVGAVGIPVEKKKKAEKISKSANANFKKAQKLYLTEDDDDDLKGFHLFDEYNSEEEESDGVIKLDEMEKSQLAVLVRSLLVENAILKDAAQRARTKLDSRKQQIKDLERNKIHFVKVFASEMESMRDIIRTLVTPVQDGGRRKTFA